MRDSEKQEKQEQKRGRDKDRERSRLYKQRVQIISAVVFLLLIAAATIACIPLIKDLRSPQGLEQMKQRLESYGGAAGALIFTFIQALQVVIAVVPPIQILGGVLFGWLWGAVLSTLGVVIGTAAVFLIVGKLGRPLAEAFVDDKLFERFGFLNDERKLVRILMLLYIIPGIPKDILTYIVSLTKISRRDFFMYVLPCRIPAIVLSTVFGSNVKDGNYKTAVIIIAAAALVCIVGYAVKEPFLDMLAKRRHKHDDSDKDKDDEE